MPLTIEILPYYLLVSGDGLGSLSEAQQHFRDLSALLVTERKAAKGARLLIDLQRARPHPPEVAAHIERVLPMLYREGDRVAVLVQNTSIKVGTKTSHNSLYSDVFLSREAAEAYLSGYWMCEADSGSSLALIKNDGTSRKLGDPLADKPCPIRNRHQRKRDKFVLEAETRIEHRVIGSFCCETLEPVGKHMIAGHSDGFSNGHEGSLGEPPAA